jgi:hypothetical protein
MPIIETYPPSGSALTPYSVSPLRLEKMVGPNPIMYCVTRTLKSLAGTRWPTSCSAMDAAIPTATNSTPAMNSTMVTRQFLLGG